MRAARDIRDPPAKNLTEDVWSAKGFGMKTVHGGHDHDERREVTRFCTRSFSSFRASPSRTIPPIVNALIGLCLGIVKRTFPFDMMVCFPSRAIRNPILLNTRMACEELMPGILGILQTVTMSCSAFFTPHSSASTCNHSRMAILMFSTASARVTPCEWQPGSAGQLTAHPSSDSINLIWYRMFAAYKIWFYCAIPRILDW